MRYISLISNSLVDCIGYCQIPYKFLIVPLSCECMFDLWLIALVTVKFPTSF